MTPYYSEPGIAIYHGDCAVIAPTLGRFDLLCTDPPYGIGVRTKGRGCSDVNRRGGRQLWTSHDRDPVHGDDHAFDPTPILSLAPRAVLWGANNYASRLPDSSCWLVWDRKCGRAADSEITDCELAAIIGHRFKTVRIFRHMWAGYQRDSEVGDKVMHPTQKPVALMSFCLAMFPEVRTVVDPYMGSGPIARACKDRGLQYVGIERELKYCEIAVRRLAQTTLALGVAP